MIKREQYMKRIRPFIILLAENLGFLPMQMIKNIDYRFYYINIQNQVKRWAA